MAFINGAFSDNVKNSGQYYAKGDDHVNDWQTQPCKFDPDRGLVPPSLLFNPPHLANAVIITKFINDGMKEHMHHGDAETHDKPMCSNCIK